jgi:hypothetical protein
MGMRNTPAPLSGADAKLQDQQRRYEMSGKSAIAFCQDEGIPISTFYQRRARLKKKVAGRRPGARALAGRFIDAGAMIVAPPALPAMQMPHRMVQSSERVEVRIDLGGGVVLHVTRS